jgi:serine/threonine-protein kinase RsbW
MSGNTVTRFFPAVLENLYEMLDFIQGAARECHLSDKSCEKVQLASEEAIVNIIQHAALKATDEIQINCTITPKQFEISFMDSGKVWDPETIAKKADVTSIAEKRKLGSLGLHLIKKNSDKFTYRRILTLNTLHLVFLK